MKWFGKYSTSYPLGNTQVRGNIRYCYRAAVPHRDKPLSYCCSCSYGHNMVVAAQHFHVESGERDTMSSWPGVRGSTVSTSKVGGGLVVEEGGTVVGGVVVAAAVVLVEGVVVTAGG
jgi:hypothetical protein